MEHWFAALSRKHVADSSAGSRRTETHISARVGLIVPRCAVTSISISTGATDEALYEAARYR